MELRIQHNDSSHICLKKLRFLVAEDNKTNRLVIGAMMAKLGYETDFAEDGQSAVFKAQHNFYHAILMDLGMPVMDGIDATRRIRNSSGRCSSVPVIAITANWNLECCEACASAGITDILVKPLKWNDIRGLALKMRLFHGVHCDEAAGELSLADDQRLTAAVTPGETSNLTRVIDFAQSKDF